MSPRWYWSALVVSTLRFFEGSPGMLIMSHPNFVCRPMQRQGFSVGILGKISPIAFTPPCHVRSVVGWATHGLLRLLSRIRAGTKLDISNIDSKKHQPNMYFSPPDAGLRFQEPECNKKQKIQSTQRERKKYQIDGRGVQCFKSEPLQQQHTSSTGMEPWSHRNDFLSKLLPLRKRFLSSEIVVPCRRNGVYFLKWPCSKAFYTFFLP